MTNIEEGERLQKFLSRMGQGSRRQAEAWIQAGWVSVNEQPATLGQRVNPTVDRIYVKGRLVQESKETLYIMMNKPKGVLVSKHDPKAQGRKTVFDLLPQDLAHKVWAVGRLDVGTEGLLILTNDGELTEELAHPRYAHEKEYEVITKERPSESQLKRLRTGVPIPTGMSQPAKAEARSGKLYITLTEGKKRQIRYMVKNVGLTLLNLKRIRINQLVLPKDLPVGQFKKMEKSDVVT